MVFNPAEKTVRFVMTDARQVEMLDVTDGLAPFREDEVYRELASQFVKMEILPGAMANAVVPIDAGVDFSEVKVVFWGKEKPWPLKDYFLTRGQVEALTRDGE